MTLRLAIAACALLAAAAATATAQAGTVKKGAAMLTDDKGMTLYTYDKDEAGTSNCVDACAQNWPPLAADAGAQADGDLSIVTRPDGSRQWAYKGKPLYTWIKDAKPGDTTGDGVNEVWHVAKP
jgi:predicted lipoprotein with Yx(FWY)xxD motif